MPDPACPATVSNLDSAFIPEGEFTLWDHGNGGEAEMTPNGNFLLFAGVGRFTPDDTGDQQALFRYDFETGELIRVSVGHRGNDGNGNDDAYPAEFAGRRLRPNTRRRRNRAISADGSTVIFRTAAPLVSRDTNQTTSVGICESWLSRKNSTPAATSTSGRKTATAPAPNPAAASASSPPVTPPTSAILPP